MNVFWSNPGKSLRLKDIPTDTVKHVPEREKADQEMQKAAEKIGQMQDLLYAEGRRSLLVILQGMDASGKDGTVRKVFDAVNPTGVRVTSFGSLRARSCGMIFYGGAMPRLRRADTSGCLTGRITRTCWWCGCMRRGFCRESCAMIKMNGTGAIG